MTTITTVLTGSAALVVVIGLATGLPMTVTFGAGGLLLAVALYVMRYRRWLRRHPPQSDWQPSRGFRVGLLVARVLSIGMGIGVLAFVVLIYVRILDLGYRDITHGDWGSIPLFAFVLAVVTFGIRSPVRMLRREWRDIRRAPSKAPGPQPQDRPN